MKLKSIFISSITLLVGVFASVQVASKQLNFYLQDDFGDNDVLKDIKMNMYLYMTDPNAIKISLDDKKLQYSYENRNYDSMEDGRRTSPIEQREEYYMSNPQVEQKQENSMSNYSDYMDEDGNTCIQYRYLQEKANLELGFIMYEMEDQTVMSGQKLKTQLTVHSQDDFELYFSRYMNEDNGKSCSDDRYTDTDDYAIFANYSYVENNVEKTKDGVYYTMPNILPNMEGKADIYRFNKRDVNKNDPIYIGNSSSVKHILEPESIYSFEVKRGTYGTMKVYGDNLYLWTYYDGEMKLQMFDTDMNLLHEESMPYTMSGYLNGSRIYANDETMILLIDNKLILYNLTDGTYMSTIDERHKNQPDFYTYNEDIYYHDGKLYISALEETIEEQENKRTLKPVILVYENNTLLYKGSFILYENTIDYEPINPNYVSDPTPFMIRGWLTFVRDAV